MLRDRILQIMSLIIYTGFIKALLFWGVRLRFWWVDSYKNTSLNNKSVVVIDLNDANQVRDVNSKKYKHESFAD